MISTEYFSMLPERSTQIALYWRRAKSSMLRIWGGSIRKPGVIFPAGSTSRDPEEDTSWRHRVSSNRKAFSAALVTEYRESSFSMNPTRPELRSKSASSTRVSGLRERATLRFTAMVVAPTPALAGRKENTSVRQIGVTWGSLRGLLYTADRRREAVPLKRRLEELPHPDPHHLEQHLLGTRLTDRQNLGAGRQSFDVPGHLDGRVQVLYAQQDHLRRDAPQQAQQIRLRRVLIEASHQRNGQRRQCRLKLVSQLPVRAD